MYLTIYKIINVYYLFFHCCDYIPDKNQHEKGFVFLHSQKVQSILHGKAWCGVDGFGLVARYEVAGSHLEGSESSGKWNAILQ